MKSIGIGEETMTDELKPVRCGCGGATRRCADPITGQWFVQCRACGTVALYYNSEAEAVEAWNRAMSGNVQKCAKDAQCSKRTTKVPYCPEKYYCDDALKLMAMNIFGDYIYATDDIDLEKLREALNTLSEREQRIMYLRYQNCETLENIGKEFGVTKERIRQIIARALRILRHPKFKIVKAKLAEPERKWIPVSERLPDKDGDYLVWLDDDFRNEYDIDDEIGIVPFEVDCEGFGYWQQRYDHESFGWVGEDWEECKVTAWMPMPEPYRGEE